MPFAYKDDVALADVAFEAWGQTLEEMFIAAADAVTGAMVAELETVQARKVLEIEVRSSALDMLLFNLLQEILFFKDAEGILLRIACVGITSQSGEYVARATARGETIDSGRHETIVDVKAVTLHLFSVEKTSRGWQAFVVLDV
jgi:SHS2 domain-containing protein